MRERKGAHEDRSLFFGAKLLNEEAEWVHFTRLGVHKTESVHCLDLMNSATKSRDQGTSKECCQ